MKRAVLIRSALMIALLSPSALLLARKQSESLDPASSRRDVEKEFLDFYQSVNCFETSYDMHAKTSLYDSNCSPEETALAHEAILDLDDDDLFWTKWCITRKQWINFVIWQPLKWIKFIHPLDERKQIWVARMRSGRDLVVVAKARIGSEATSSF